MASPRTQFYHPAAEIDTALKGIERCIRRAEGAALVVGQPGTGKSLLLLKLAEQIRDDFDVALLTGASICTRRALWQAILAAIGEPYRGIDETELRIAIVERIRGLAAAGSGLVILVDEAHTLPTRLIEELRLLTNVPTPLPAVHIVLAGSGRLDEMLGSPRMASLAQRVAVRGYLEPLDHAETLAYLQTQTRSAGLQWDELFAAGCDDAVYRVTEGVPRLINQVCDHALVIVAECDRLVTPADIAAAWRDIQRLPAPSGMDSFSHEAAERGEAAAAFGGYPDDQESDACSVVEFGSGDGLFGLETCVEPEGGEAGGEEPGSQTPLARPGDLFGGPDVEMVFDGAGDPFEDLFGIQQGDSARYGMEGPDDFRDRQSVTVRDGQGLGRLLATFGRADMPLAPTDAPAATPTRASDDAVSRGPASDASGVTAGEIDDSDMVVIEEDLDGGAEAIDAGSSDVFTVRPSDYRSLFTRLRRGR